MESNSTLTSPILADEIIPMGRSYKEYIQMFNLFNIHENRSFLDCGGGSSDFNQEMTRLGKRVISIDPLYCREEKELKEQLENGLIKLKKKVELEKELFRWKLFPTADQMFEERTQIMNAFLKDYKSGKTESRYINASLPRLPFNDNEFEIALSSHFLFLYSTILSYSFHIKSICEMARVAKEVRVFPITDYTGKPSPHLKEIIKTLKFRGLQTQFVSVPYEFRKNANQCLVIRKRQINNL
jgi:ubiquinone/menaquinone biosynthesis C-methylase UbiE